MYGDEHFTAMRNCIKNRKGLLEFVEYGSIKAELDNCLAILETENAAPAPAAVLTFGSTPSAAEPEVETIVAPHAVTVADKAAEENLAKLDEDARKDIDQLF